MEGEYKLDVLKEIMVTGEYLKLRQDVRECQTEEPLQNCTTRRYLESILGECGCLPLNMRLSNNKVCFFLRE